MAEAVTHRILPCGGCPYLIGHSKGGPLPLPRYPLTNYLQREITCGLWRDKAWEDNVGQVTGGPPLLLRTIFIRRGSQGRVRELCRFRRHSGRDQVLPGVQKLAWLSGPVPGKGAIPGPSNAVLG